jgi:hypothetical protein
MLGNTFKRVKGLNFTKRKWNLLMSELEDPYKELFYVYFISSKSMFLGLPRLTFTEIGNRKFKIYRTPFFNYDFNRKKLKNSSDLEFLKFNRSKKSISEKFIWYDSEYEKVAFKGFDIFAAKTLSERLKNPFLKVEVKNRAEGFHLLYCDFTNWNNNDQTNTIKNLMNELKMNDSDLNLDNLNTCHKIINILYGR